MVKIDVRGINIELVNYDNDEGAIGHLKYGLENRLDSSMLPEEIQQRIKEFTLQFEAGSLDTDFENGKIRIIRTGVDHEFRVYTGLRKIDYRNIDPLCAWVLRHWEKVKPSETEPSGVRFFRVTDKDEFMCFSGFLIENGFVSIRTIPEPPYNIYLTRKGLNGMGLRGIGSDEI